MGALRNFLERQDVLERKLFWIILFMVTMASICSAVFTIVEGLNLVASASSIGCSLVCFIVAGVAVKTSLYDQCYLVLCSIIGVFLLPLLFVFCGGITSGMSLYFVTSLALLSFASRGRFRTFVFVATVLVQLSTFLVTWANPEYVAVSLNRDDSYLDFMVTFVVTGVTLFCIGTFCMKSFTDERDKREEMVRQLEFLSKRDSLTELYNRRYLTHYLENIASQQRDHFYVLVLDIDSFREINNTWGFTFGDQVIASISKILLQSQDESLGECVARYGGEKFVYIIHADSNIDAFFKADKIRECVSMLHWIDNPSVHVTVSGGFMSYRGNGYYDEQQVMKKLENLLNVVRAMGRDQIRDLSE